MDICVLLCVQCTMYIQFPLCFLFFAADSTPLSHNSKWEKWNGCFIIFERCLRVELVCPATNHYSFLCALILEFIYKLPHGIPDIADSNRRCRFVFTFFFPPSSLEPSVGCCESQAIVNTRNRQIGIDK